jgi:hypothetical protein
MMDMRARAQAQQDSVAQCVPPPQAAQPRAEAALFARGALSRAGRDAWVARVAWRVTPEVCAQQGLRSAKPGSGAPHHSMGETELLELLAQRAAIDAQDSGRPALVAVRVIEHHSKERLLDLAQHQLIEVRGP